MTQKNFPSLKTLMTINRNRTSKESAILARKILTLKTTEDLEDVAYQLGDNDLYLGCYSRRELRLALLNKVLGGFGVESICNKDGKYLDYINFGDTYDTTIIFWNNRYIVSSWGDIVEKNSNNWD